MSLNDQNNLEVIASAKSLNDQNNLQVDLSGKKVIIIAPTDEQSDFPLGDLYEWDYSGDNTLFRVEVATDSGFENIEQIADVSAKELTSNVPVGDYHIRISALEVINPDESEVTGVSLNTSVREVPEGETLDITGSFQGNGDYDTTGTWTRESGTVPFSATGNTITFTGDAEDNSSDFRLTSNQDDTVFIDITITVSADTSVGQIDSRAGDEESLRLHAEALSVAGWDQNFGWSTSSMSLDDNIYGVTTQMIGDELRVTEIDLMANNLVGELPEFPGLQECWKYRVKQMEAGMDGDNPPERISGRIPDSIGNNTKVTHLSLSGRKNASGNPLDVFLAAPDEKLDYNKKRGVAANQFEQGLPDSLYNLELNMLEIDGQNGQFGGVLKEGCSNWDITHFYAHGNMWYEGNNTGSAWGGAVPSGMKAWVNNIFITFGDNIFDSYASDMFDGWVNNERYFEISWDGSGNYFREDAFVDQSIPDFSHLTQSIEFRMGNLGFTGLYPKYIHGFDNIEVIDFGLHRFVDSRDLELENVSSKFKQLYMGGNSTVTEGNLSGSLYTGDSSHQRNMITFDCRVRPNLKDVLEEGMSTWYKLRYVRAQNTGGTTLPSKPPGMFSPSLTLLHLQGSKITGQYTSAWANAGSKVKYGGEYATGTITAVGGNEVDGYWIEDSNADFPDLLAESPNMIVHNPASGSGVKRRRVESNTSIRINYESYTNNNGNTFGIEAEVGDTYILERNSWSDNRPFDDGFLLNNNFLYGALPADGAPTQMGPAIDDNGDPFGNTASSFNISGNLYQMKDIAPVVSAYEAMATDKGYNFVYAPQGILGKDIPDGYFIPTFFQDDNRIISAGENPEIDFSDQSYTGNVYTWKRRLIGESTYSELSDGGDISGATTGTITITDFQSADQGDYILEITNSDAPDLTSVSGRITLTLG